MFDVIVYSLVGLLFLFDSYWTQAREQDRLALAWTEALKWTCWRTLFSCVLMGVLVLLIFRSIEGLKYILTSAVALVAIEMIGFTLARRFPRSPTG